MKKTIVITLALICNALAFAQKAEYIETFVANKHEPEWYKEQAEAWQKIVDENPNDQWAWRNLFRATNYYEQFTGGWGENQDESKTADVIRKMEATLPDSYVLNLCKCRFCLTTDEAARRGDNIFRAIELMPEDICPEDFDFLTVRLWITDPENPNIKDMCTRTYQNKYYPTRIMHFNYNMLQCLQPNALYFSNGDLDTVPMKVLQEALGIRTDVNIINVSFLYTESFKNMLYKKLNIKPLEVNWQDYGQYGEDWLKHYEADIMMYLIKESKRPAYFSPTNPKTTIINKDSIYNEGLVLKYSPKQYNNFDVAMYNVKEVYNLEYLAEPDLVYDSWETSSQIDLNHVTLLSPRKAYWGWVATPAAAVAGLVFGLSLHLFMVDRQEVRYVQQTDTVRILHPVHDTLYLTQVVEKEKIVVKQVADSDQAESVPIQEGADTSACTSIMCDGINYSILASN